MVESEETSCQSESTAEAVDDSDNVHIIELADRVICLLGTAHVSRASAELVERTIRGRCPDTVCVELCQPRLESLSNPERWRETDIFQVIRSGKSYVLLTQLVLAAFQRRLATKFGVQPGEEMRRALALSEETGAKVVVIDREIRITLKRAWASAGFLSMSKVIISLVGSVFSSEEISESEIEELKKGDALSALMGEFSAFLPGVKEVLIDERDQYMAAKINNCGGSSVVAVVGAGHVPGIIKALGTDLDIAELETIPPTKIWYKAIAWGIPGIIIAMFIVGFVTMDRATSFDMLSAWFLANGILAALGALIALAHPLTIITAFFAAPFTSLNPTIAAGWVCGLVEALLRKPRVKDLETIADDLSTIKGFWTNRVAKILLVVILANIGSVIGTFVGGIKIAALLGGGSGQ